MRFEVSERIETTADRAAIMDLARNQFRKISESIEENGEGFIAKSIEATFGSINRSDRTTVNCKKLPNAWLITAEVAYRPSVIFWIFFVLSLFSYVGWIIPIAFYLLQRNTVKSAVSAALTRVANEMRETIVVAAPVQQNHSSVVDELAKLADLKERGHLTEEEFASKKQQLLQT